MTVRILTGDCRDVLKTLPDESVHCVVTSPPYWGLRDYGVAGQLGLEPDFRDYIETMVGVFREVRRVLRKDGTCWLNMGDSYASAWVCNRRSEIGLGSLPDGSRANRTDMLVSGLKEKDLCGIPWRLAFALQADGWWLRSDIIWSKPNPMPESVTDRPTKAHEYLFLLSKAERYYYDATAIQETAIGPAGGNVVPTKGAGDPKMRTRDGLHLAQERARQNGGFEFRNRRTVWEIATAPFSEAHFATFPPALVEPCIKAGTSEKGCCAKCGAPWVRDNKISYENLRQSGSGTGFSYGKDGLAPEGRLPLKKKITETIGWSPSCWHSAEPTIPCTVLDPFGGAGTTGLVADRLERNAILIELNPKYAEMAERRLKGDGGLFASVEYDAQDDFGKSLQVGYQAIRERIANGGPGWTPKEPELL